MGHNKSFSTVDDDDFEFDEAYFRQFYKPLSSLPTPPPSSRASSAAQSPLMAAAHGEENLESQFLGPAAHLARMLPPGASFVTPSVPIVQSMLACANLPMDTIALAVNILDSLNSRFSRSWRLSFPLHDQSSPSSSSSSQPVFSSNSKRHTLPPPSTSTAGASAAAPRHIDAVSPEVIILAALTTAQKFVEDAAAPAARHVCDAWAAGRWTPAQLARTERCVVEALGYRLLPLWEPALIREARHDIELARREILRESATAGNRNAASSNGKRGGGGGVENGHDDAAPTTTTRCHVKSMSAGFAVTGPGRALTPVETPGSEGAAAAHRLPQETRDAFGGAAAGPLPGAFLRLPAAVAALPR
ncbi:hypothetical protein GGR56DRAFT_322289 [Xylariaceae sp. FL0804]|nr:hypothetical protein GGR56DRAFT_322289 [Xylariaceae sp. FL0804]